MSKYRPVSLLALVKLFLSGVDTAQGSSRDTSSFVDTLVVLVGAMACTLVVVVVLAIIPLPLVIFESLFLIFASKPGPTLLLIILDGPNAKSASVPPLFVILTIGDSEVDVGVEEKEGETGGEAVV